MTAATTTPFNASHPPPQNPHLGNSPNMSLQTDTSRSISPHTHYWSSPDRMNNCPPVYIGAADNTVTASECPLWIKSWYWGLSSLTIRFTRPIFRLGCCPELKSSFSRSGYLRQEASPWRLSSISKKRTSLRYRTRLNARKGFEFNRGRYALMCSWYRYTVACISVIVIG